MEYGSPIGPRPFRPSNPQIRAEAVEWLLRFSEGEIDAAGRREFSYWLRMSPENLRAYLRVAAFWQEAPHLDGKRAPRDIQALIASARSEANVFPLPFISGDFVSGALASCAADGAASPAPSAPPRPRTRVSLPMKRASVGVAAALLVAVGAFGTFQHLTRHIYETRVGEQRTVNLPDGSTVVLNADSRIKVHYGTADRTIELEAGQALFKVARNRSRPFVVRSGNTSVRAVGTEFDVYRKSTGTTVTVVEGKVAVGARGQPVGSHSRTSEHTSRDLAAPPPRLVYLTAGEQVTIPKADLARAHSPAAGIVREPRVRLVKVEQATAWTEGLLVFDGTPLTEVIRDFNRQNTKPLVLQGTPELGRIRISGTFPANGAERITRFLQERFDVVANETDDQIELRRAPRSP